MKHIDIIAITVIACLACMILVPNVSALSVSVSQSGADSDEVMKDGTFVVEASGWTGSCATGTISFTGCSSCSLDGEETSKSIGGEASSISWTTVSASSTAAAQTITVSVSSGCTLQQATTSSFDIVLPPSLELSATTGASSVTTGGTFNTNLNVVNSGETTAQSVSISVASPFSASCSTISSIEEGQSASESCVVTAPSTSGTRTVTFTASSTNADSDTDSFTMQVSGGSGDDGDGSSGGGGVSGGGGDQNKTSRPTLIPGVGLRNNTKLQAAIEKVLAKGQMSAQARENMLRLSASITSDMSTTRMINVSSGKSKITTRMRYQGQQQVRNMIIYESVPKTFALNASLVTVSAPGATVEIAEDDPSWVIMYDQIDPNDEIVITYEVTGSKSSSNIDGMVTEIYAEGLEEAPVTQTTCTAGQKRCSPTTNMLQQCSQDGTTWENLEACKYGCNSATLECNTEQPGPGTGATAGELPVMWIVIIAAIVIIIIIGILVYRRQNE